MGVVVAKAQIIIGRYFLISILLKTERVQNPFVTIEEFLIDSPM